jgi:hypothetical protein
VNYAVLALDLMCRLGQELPWRLLAHYIALTGRVGELVCGIGLAIAELLHFQWRLDLGHSFGDVLAQGLNVDGLADCAGHDGFEMREWPAGTVVAAITELPDLLEVLDIQRRWWSFASVRGSVLCKVRLFSQNSARVFHVIVLS